MRNANGRVAFISLPPRVQSIVNSTYMWLCVCLSARISQHSHVKTAVNFLYTFIVALSSSYNYAIHLVLLVLWMTSRFYIINTKDDVVLHWVHHAVAPWTMRLCTIAVFHNWLLSCGFKSHSAQTRSFRRLSSQPISWLSTEELKQKQQKQNLHP